MRSTNKTSTNAMGDMWGIDCVYFATGLKKAKTEGKQCHAKTMKSKRSC